MQLNGQHDFEATPTAVWEVLHDPSAIARALPGVETLEPIAGEENAFRGPAPSCRWRRLAATTPANCA